MQTYLFMPSFRLLLLALAWTSSQAFRLHKKRRMDAISSSSFENELSTNVGEEAMLLMNMSAEVDSITGNSLPHWFFPRNGPRLVHRRRRRQAIVYFDATGTREDMRIVRQGNSSYAGRPMKYKFTTGKLHKAYMVKTGPLQFPNRCIDRVFVQKGRGQKPGRMCNYRPFTNQQATCNVVPKSIVTKLYERIKGLAPKVERGFGVEMEYGSHFLPGDRSHGHQQNAMLQCVKQAGAQAFPSFSRGYRMEGTGNDKVIKAHEAQEVGAPASETVGFGFEIVTPGPPNVPSGQSGFKSLLEAMVVLKKIGIQAGPEAGGHVHINVLNAQTAGKKLTRRQIIYVWAAYARYQYVIDEMLSPSRIGNFHSKELLLGNCNPINSGNCDQNACGCIRRFFNQMHQWLRQGKVGSDLEFCNYILDVPGHSNPCASKPMQRRFHMNMAPLHRYGTVEFRTHSGTYDEVRLGRWLQFAVAFVEHFGKAGGGATGMSKFFATQSADEGYKQLQRAQQFATRKELFKQLKGKVSADSEAYFAGRFWEQIRDPQGKLIEDPTCHGPGTPLVLKPSCR